MKYQILLLITLFFYNKSFSQPSSGDQLRENGKLKEAIKAYKIDFLKTPGNSKNTYNLACAYALTFQKDSAYYYLKIALKNDKSLWALADSDLFGIVDDNRWSVIEEGQINKYENVNGELKQPEYAKELLRLIIKDQALDYYIDQAKLIFGKDGNIPQWYYPIGSYKKQIIKGNYKNLNTLIKEYGWPKYSTVGILAADAPLLIINHHSDDSVRKKYLQQIKQSCLNKEGSCLEFAKINDRILVNENKLQIYGMQFRYNEERNLEPFPIKDPEYVDQRRKLIGLEPLKEYLKRKIDYDWTVSQKMN